MRQATCPIIALLWRSYLPYHAARLVSAANNPALSDVRIVGMQVTSDAAGYEFLSGTNAAADVVTCLPGAHFSHIAGAQVYDATLAALRRVAPQLVFAPASPFPEGMAAVRYARASGARVFIMDDSWVRTDHRGWLVRGFKRVIHSCVEGAFVPDEWYADYFADLGIARERIVYPVNVVDNDLFTRPAGRTAPGPPRFLFVGRDLPRKGLAVLLEAYSRYRMHAAKPWPLHIVGPIAAGKDPLAGVVYLGPRVGDRLLAEYWSAAILVVPSDFDQWGLVVNEGMAASLPVIASFNVGAARSLVAEGVTGWTFPPRDVDSLAERLLRASSLAPEDREAIGAAARERLRLSFSLEHFAMAIDRARRLERLAAPGVAGRAAARLWRGRLRAY